MVKFVITVSDGYIKERANLDNITQMVTAGGSIPKTLLDSMAFTLIENDVKTNTDVEYNISSNDYADSKKLKVFNDMMSLLASLVFIKDEVKVDK